MYANIVMAGCLAVGLISIIFIKEDLKRQDGENRPSIEERLPTRISRLSHFSMK